MENGLRSQASDLHDLDTQFPCPGDEGIVGFLVRDDGVELAQVADAEEGVFIDFRVIDDSVSTGEPLNALRVEWSTFGMMIRRVIHLHAFPDGKRW